MYLTCQVFFVVRFYAGNILRSILTMEDRAKYYISKPAEIETYFSKFFNKFEMMES